MTHAAGESPPRFEPRTPDWESRVRESFARQRVMATIGARLARVLPGAVEIELPYRADLGQQHGYLHAGIVATVVDSACGYAAYSLMSAESDVVSVEFKLNLLAPAVGDLLIARARVVRAGRTITVCAGDAIMRTGAEEKLVGTMLGTMMAVRG